MRTGPLGPEAPPQKQLSAVGNFESNSDKAIHSGNEDTSSENPTDLVGSVAAIKTPCPSLAPIDL
jgi:hypothetical protein